MSIYSVTIEWGTDDEHSYPWEDYKGQPLPLPPTGTDIRFRRHGISVNLRVEKTICWFKEGVSFYIMCKLESD